MELLPGWGPPTWSPASKADALSLALYFLLLGSPHCTETMPPCKEEEYPVGDECCPKCRPGYYLKQACGVFTGTLCAPCTPGTYTAHVNGLSECLQCRVCDPGAAACCRWKQTPGPAAQMPPAPPGDCGSCSVSSSWFPFFCSFATSG